MLMIRLVEGKNRQIKKMFEEVGHPVKRLRRIMIGPIDLKGLTPGTYRRLKPHEVNVLRTMALKEDASHPLALLFSFNYANWATIDSILNSWIFSFINDYFC